MYTSPGHIKPGFEGKWGKGDFQFLQTVFVAISMTIPAQFHRAKVLNFHFFLEKFQIWDFPGAQPPVLFRATPQIAPQYGIFLRNWNFWDVVTFFLAMTLTIPAHFHRAKVVNFYFFLRNFRNNDFPGAQPPVLFRARPQNQKSLHNFFRQTQNDLK